MPTSKNLASPSFCTGGSDRPPKHNRPAVWARGGQKKGESGLQRSVNQSHGLLDLVDHLADGEGLLEVPVKALATQPGELRVG